MKTLDTHLRDFSRTSSFFEDNLKQTLVDTIEIDGKTYRRYTNEYWTAQQRQSNALHEISYRACFKAQLPQFFIKLLTREGDCVYDPFSGRGTTAIESALLGRTVVANDINPLSAILIRPRLFIPELEQIQKRLEEIPDNGAHDDLDLSMFYHPATEKEIKQLRSYLYERKAAGKEDEIDAWIRMVATNRLTGHSPGFFSVYTLPPNQAVRRESQIKINTTRNQVPSYRSTKELILRKSRSLLSNITGKLRSSLREVGERSQIITRDARDTNLARESIHLTVTSPPFLDVVNYADDNWLRCWFNAIDEGEVSKQITVLKSVDAWANFMEEVFKELYRLTVVGGAVAFEVGEVRNGKIKLDEVVIPIGEKVGFSCHGVVINSQSFTKTANIWGISNNKHGTNTNRIVLFGKA